MPIIDAGSNICEPTKFEIVDIPKAETKVRGYLSRKVPAYTETVRSHPRLRPDNLNPPGVVERSIPISSQEDFQKIVQNPAGIYHQTNDLVLEGFWINDILFTGEYNGGLYSITFEEVMTCSHSTYSGGLFSSVGEGAVLKNIRICNSKAEPGERFGFITGNSYRAGFLNCRIENCEIVSTGFHLEAGLGLLIGNADAGFVWHCRANGSIKTYGNIAGGLVGVSRNIIYTDCSIVAKIFCDNNWQKIGGLVAESYHDEIDLISAEVDIFSGRAGDGPTRKSIGGLVGVCAQGEFLDSMATGRIMLSESPLQKDQCIGGVIGRLEETTNISSLEGEVKMENCLGAVSIEFPNKGYQPEKTAVHGFLGATTFLIETPDTQSFKNCRYLLSGYPVRGMFSLKDGPELLYIEPGELAKEMPVGLSDEEMVLASSYPTWNFQWKWFPPSIQTVNRPATIRRSYISR